ncbi:hypothetical protein PLICRDRAFT_84683, partial [Plicaturopsis crispa FD-325 SS-3]
GLAGAFSEGDLVQEFFNRLLEAITKHKGTEFGEPFIRNVISRNLHHFARLKSEWRAGVGLAPRSGRHKDPHANPEVRTLLRVYADHELHYRRPGRSLDDRDVNDFDRGINSLRDTKLQKWI